MTMNSDDGRLRRQILGALGLSLLMPACIDTTVQTDAGSGGSGGSPTSATSGTPSDASETLPDDDSAECGDAISRVVCEPPAGADSSSGFADTGTDTGDMTSTGDSGSGSGSETGMSSGSETGGGSTGDGPPPGPVSCEGVEPNDYSFCVYEMGPVYEEDGQCCRRVSGFEECCDGRPFIVEERIRTASPVMRADWCGGERPSLEGLDSTMRAELAAAWQGDAMMEHASIASFSRFVLHLMGLGAPPELVLEAQRAIVDEVAHARTCFALASAYAGHPVGPGALSVDGALDGPLTLASAAVAAVREGCIGETLAAHQAAVAATRAQESVIIHALNRIAQDEARHAELAWRFVAWAIEQGGAEVTDAVAQAFVEYGESESLDDRPAPADPAIWRAHGRLAPRELSEQLARARREIVMPCARALLEHATSRQSTERRARLA